MNKLILVLAIIFTASGILDVFSSIAISLFAYYLVTFLTKMNEILAFREFIMVLFSMNYLFAPAVMMNIDPSHLTSSVFKIKLPKEQFLQITIPAILLLQLGMYSIKTKIFEITFALVKVELYANEMILKRWTIIGIICGLMMPALVGTEIGFIIYLISLIKYIGGFGLYAIDKPRNKLYIAAVFFFELSQSFGRGMFGESIMWLTFFVTFASYLKKPPVYIKTIIIFVAFSGFVIFQNSKNDYRSKVWTGEEEGSLSTFISSTEDKRDGVFDITSITTSLHRVNQGWILSSSVDRMNSTEDFQGLAIFKQYFEAALLPRFLAPDKLRAGNKEIFNQFSGHTVEGGTSMGLGILADGYVAYGYWGTLGACFLLGLIFSLIFKTVEAWTKISPFFIFFIFPILNYAVRPDCETQAILGHIVKSLFVYSLLIFYYGKVLRKTYKQLAQKLDINESEATINYQEPKIAI